MNQHKTKVIALRVTQEEYDALAVMADDYNIKMGKYVYNCLIPAIALGAEVIGKRQKREEARIKRLAKKEAASGL
jgi:hypothetical protein